MNFFLWATFLILKVLVLYHDATGDERVEEVVRKALKALDRHIDRTTLLGWGICAGLKALLLYGGCMSAPGRRGCWTLLQNSMRKDLIG